MEEPISNSFNINFLCWKIFGISAGEFPSRNYKYYSFFCLITFSVVYNALMTVSLFDTPLQVDLFVEELMFYVNGISVMTKVVTVILWRKEIRAVCDILDCEYFKGNDEVGRQIVAKSTQIYKIGWNLQAFLCNVCFFFGSVLPVILYFLPIDSEINFLVSNYYFLSDETKEYYFGYLYGYQFTGIYIQMMYNVNIDSFFAGLLFYGITQMKLLSHELRSLKWKKPSAADAQEKTRIQKLKYCLHHYESILKYCDCVQDLFSLSLSVQIATSSAIICSVLCALLLSNQKVVFMLTYLAEMTLQIFVPAWLGTQLISESEKLVFAAYESDWITRSKSYKSSLKLFVERANRPVMITGMKLFTLNLETFVVIMKTAYSFITLVRNFQERN